MKKSWMVLTIAVGPGIVAAIASLLTPPSGVAFNTYVNEDLKWPWRAGFTHCITTMPGDHPSPIQEAVDFDLSYKPVHSSAARGEFHHYGEYSDGCGSGSTDTDGDYLRNVLEGYGYNTCAFVSDEVPGWSTCSTPQDSDGDSCSDTLEVLDLNGDRMINVGDQLILSLRVVGGVAVDPVSEAIFDVNKDGYINVGDELFMALNTCDTRPDQIGCPMCPPED